MPDSISTLTPALVQKWFADLPMQEFSGQRILLVIPDSIRTGQLPLLFDSLFNVVRPHCFALDVVVALGSHPPMSDTQICKLLGIGEAERGRLFYQLQLFNHEWDRPDRLLTIGTVTSDKITELSHGLLSLDVPIQINSRIHDYDLLLAMGPVFPYEVYGFSGGNENLIPGLAGIDTLDFVQKLSTLGSPTATIGIKDTPMRRFVDAAAALIPQKRRAITFVAPSECQLCGLFYGTPEAAWNQAANLAAQLHVDQAHRNLELIDTETSADREIQEISPVRKSGEYRDRFDSSLRN